MKKFYSLVLMAAALLIGTNAWAEPVSTWDGLKSALQAGGTVTLSADINVTADNASIWDGIWIGSESVDGDAPTAVLDLAGHNITINSGNYQNKKGVTQEQALNPFVISKGSLKIKSATGAKIQVVQGQSPISKSTNVFSVFGAGEANKQDPKTNPFTYLEIGDSVTVETPNGTVVLVDQLTTTHNSISKLAVKPTYGTASYAYGVCVEIKGTLISQGAASTVVSTDSKTGLKSLGNKCYGLKVNGSVKTPATDALKMYAPYVHIHPHATLQSDNRSGFQGDTAIMAGSAAAYASGFAQWLIEGNCIGATGVYIGSGFVTINDAKVKSAAAEYDAAGAGSHANGSGSAIVINSRSGGYDGEVEVTIKGETEVEATSGYAMEEVVNTISNETNVEAISITGGSFAAGEQGAIVITENAADASSISITGGTYGTITAEDIQIGTQSLQEFLEEQTEAGEAHISFVDGNMVISEGSAPVGNETVAGSTGSVNWKHLDSSIAPMTDTLAADLTLDELEINQTYNQTLTIAKDVTFTVGRVVMGSKAQIIVEAGAKLIVTGEQGVAAFVASNIVLRNEAGERSIFLFHPNVESNKHPMAKVELITNSWRNETFNQWECFGLPTYEAISDINCEGPQAFVAVWENGDWSSVGIIGTTGFDKSKLNKPFAAYDLLANRAQNVDAPVITIEGQLVGNVNGDLNVNYRWTPFANSYTAELDIKECLIALGGAQYVAQGVYVAELSGNGHLAWNPVDLYQIEDGEAKYTKLAPMQAFMLNNPGSFSEVRALDYESMVWAPATSKPNTGAGAPRRAAASETTAKVRVDVANEQGVVDKVILRENANNVYALEKYMNEDMNIYVQADEKNAIVNAEELENTFVGFSTVNGGNFTISFANVAGREMALVDHETGARVAIAEGNTYEFTAAANSVNDYRFEIVEPAKLPTAIENAEAVKSAKGIYTITGQYVGEMNVWNTLPAGIYVVNGEKRVK